MIAAFEAMEAMKILSGRAASVRRVIYTADLWNGPVRESRMPERDPDCPACALRDFIYLTGRPAPVSLCGRNAVQIHERRRPLALVEMAERLRGLGTVRANEFALKFDDGSWDITFFPDGRAIIKGTTDPGVARSVYSKYVGN
jgi:adenylyltransferase/sulfurtransferase